MDQNNVPRGWGLWALHLVTHFVQKKERVRRQSMLILHGGWVLISDR